MSSRIMRIRAFDFVMLVAVFLLNDGAAEGLLNEEGQYLLEMKSKLVDGLNHLESWNSSDLTPCGWKGVNCTTNPVPVVYALVLNSLNLSGTLSPAIGNLVHLSHLDLSFNEFSGNIPPEIGNCSKLESLFLHNNGFAGSIPREIGKLSSLIRCNICNNKLSGSVPDEIGNLSSLSELVAYTNNLTGALPASVGKLKSLTVFRAGQNLLSGSIPAEIGGRHIARTYNLGNGVNFGNGFVEVLAATQTPGESGMNWFQGTADAVRQFTWVFEDGKNKNIEHILILSGDHLYRMDYMDFVQKHIDTGADITVSCVLVDDSRASDYGLMKIDKSGRIVQFSEKPKGADLETMKIDTTFLRLSHQEDMKYPYIASMGVYVFRRDVLLKLLRWRYPKSNDFGSDILPSAVEDHNVQAYLFNDYWEDIGTIKTFFDANLALTDQPPKFEFYDPKTPFYTSPRFLPPTKVEKCRILDAIMSHGCFLRECSVQHSIVGVRSRLDYGVELKDTMMMGADYYETEAEIASLLAEGKVPIGVGQNTKIRNCIIDMNARIGKNVIITNKDGVQEADRPDEGFYIRSGITIVQKNSTIKDKTVI